MMSPKHNKGGMPPWHHAFPILMTSYYLRPRGGVVTSPGAKSLPVHACFIDFSEFVGTMEKLSIIKNAFENSVCIRQNFENFVGISAPSSPSEILT